MPMKCLQTDLPTFFAAEDFGEDVGAIWNGDTSNPISGIFDDEDVEAQNGEGVPVLIPHVTFTCAKADIPNLTEGDTLVIRSTLYFVRSWMNDGAGVIEIMLEKGDPVALTDPTILNDNTVLADG